MKFLRPKAFVVAMAILPLIGISLFGEDIEENDQPLVIKKYRFIWTVAEHGDSAFQIEKDHKKTVAVLISKSGALTFAPKDAQTVANVLSRADELQKKLRGSKGKSETVESGRLRADFRTSRTGEFSVAIGAAETFTNNLVQLNREQAMSLASDLKKAVKAAEFADEKISF